MEQFAFVFTTPLELIEQKKAKVEVSLMFFYGELLGGQWPGEQDEECKKNLRRRV